MIPGISHWELLDIEKPARYIGGEINQAPDKPEADLRVCLAFPDLYELGMSNIALKILYELLNETPGIAAERVFSPWIDMEALLRRKNLPLFSLETKRPLGAFDLLGITLPYEMTFTNVLNMLQLAQMPLHWEDRQSGPFVVAGGPSAANPLVVADFFDAILIGDGEEALPELCEVLREGKRAGRTRSQTREAIAELEGFWVPAVPKPVRRRVFKGFAASRPPLRPVIPHIETIHNRVPLEIFRGCMQGCRFCNAGFYYRPKRERPAAALAGWGQEILRGTGSEALGLISLSTSDYSCLSDLLQQIDANRVYPEQVLAIPSMRMNDRTLQLLDSTPNIKKSGLTFAPEAGSQRLRDIIKKNITEEDIISVLTATRDSAYRSVKLYFMIGLPFETEADVDAITDLVLRLDEVSRVKKLRKELSLSLSGFVPKPFTPFQWSPQISPELLKERRLRICRGLQRSRAKLSWRDETLCRLEAVLSRGDRRVGALLEAAHRNGCRFDGWNEHFNAAGWEAAFRETGLDTADFTRERDPGEPLPWDFIDFRVPRAFLEKEYRAAEALAKGSPA